MRIWEMDRFFQGTSISNIGGAFLLKEQIDFDLWGQVINTCIEQNDSIRLRLKLIDEKPVQYVSEHKNRVFKLIDFTGKTKEEQDFWMNENMRTPFDIIDSDLFEIYFIKSW